MNPAIAQYLVIPHSSLSLTLFQISEVSKYIVNKQYGNLDILKISRDLENEGIEISNEKLSNILKALKTFLFKVLKAAAA